MNNKYPPLKPYRSRFHEEWLMAFLTVVAVGAIFFSFKESGGLAGPTGLSSALLHHPVEAVASPTNDSEHPAIKPVDILSNPGIPRLRMSFPL